LKKQSRLFSGTKRVGERALKGFLIAENRYFVGRVVPLGESRFSLAFSEGNFCSYGRIRRVEENL
jgi:hypothetical protein